MTVKIYKSSDVQISTNRNREYTDKKHTKNTVYYDKLILKTAYIDTLLGPMVAISGAENLYLLEFSDNDSLENKIDNLRFKKNAIIIPGDATPINSIKLELNLYFTGKLREFETPLHLIGTEFQKKVWHALTQVPYGQTNSYLEQAKAIGNKKSFRAVANANGANKFAIIIPCHRIINHNGEIGGYGGGISRKEWLIKHEKSYLEHINYSQGMLYE